MQNTFNFKLFVLGVGILQPVRSVEVIHFLQELFPDVAHWPDETHINDLLNTLEQRNYIVCVSSKHGLYSLTHKANLRMGKRLRYFRDKVRLSLLKEVYKANIRRSDGVAQDLGGVSPSVDISSSIKDGSRPVNSGLESSIADATSLQARVNWSRLSEQHKFFRVGLDPHPSDDLIRPLRYYSFPRLKSLQNASSGPFLEKDMTTTQMAMCVGVSPRLLTSFIHKPENHYRKFTLPKKTGGEREIASPRLFLKVVQYWIKDYLLWNLKIHIVCHAYIRGRSISTNANLHSNQNFVANIDIEDFFGTISKEKVDQTLRTNEIGPKLSKLISEITTLDGCLPQGAPTSPIISNAVLFDFDNRFSGYCKEKGMVYTRYADDLTISGPDRTKIIKALEFARFEIKKFGLKLKENKTRVASKYASQRVTGLVVNEKVLPPRKYRRKVRAMFHKANLYPEEYMNKLDELKGHLSYLNSFKSQLNDRSLRHYKGVIRKLNVKKRSD